MFVCLFVCFSFLSFSIIIKIIIIIKITTKRDIKSPNILLTRSLSHGGGTQEYASKNIVAKLGDFGLTSVLSGPYQVYIYIYIYVFI